MEIVLSAVVIGLLGVVSAFALGVAAKVFYVEIDPLVAAIEEVLPGANCGGCGQPGCSGAAAAIARGVMPANGCVAGGAAVGVEVARIMGVEVKEVEPSIARVGCRYPVQRADLKYRYDGITDCRAAFVLYGGPKECPVGCIGLGSCVKACPFGALSLGPDHLPVVDENKCTGCGSCVKTCPAGIMKLTSVTNRILGEYNWDQCTAPCQRRCPAGIDIPRQIYETAQGHYEQALLTVKERNPLPLICGRICPNPCEVACRRNLVDEPVAINPLKRFVADIERENGRRLQCYKAPSTGKRAAVIGGGAQGLSAAYFLTRLGNQVKLYESRDKLGGLLRTVIPENRLPREVLDWEIQGILDLGVEAEASKTFGRDITLSQLFDQDYHTIFLATGGWDSLLMPGQSFTPSTALPSIFLLLPLTMAMAGGQEFQFGQHVVIAGDGREALSMARRLRAKGVAKVTVLSSTPLGKVGIIGEEILPAAAEGITIRPRAFVTRLMGQGDQLTGLTYRIGSMNERTIETDTLIIAGGRLPELIVTKTIDETGEKGQSAGEQPARIAGVDTKWHTILSYRAHGGDNILASREPVSDYRAVIEAVGAGRRAAASIHYILQNKALPTLDLDISHDPAQLDVDHLDNLIEVAQRAEMPEISYEERLDPRREVALGLDEKAAKTEAARCLNCGLICYYRTSYDGV